jgi:hypothetical protein
MNNYNFVTGSKNILSIQSNHRCIIEQMQLLVQAINAICLSSLNIPKLDHINLGQCDYVLLYLSANFHGLVHGFILHSNIKSPGASAQGGVGSEKVIRG